MKSIPDCTEAVQKILEIRREGGETGREIDPAILPSLPVRQRPEQSFQKSDTWTVDPYDWKTRWAQIGKCFFSRFSLASNSDSFVSDGRCKHCTSPRSFHTRKHFLACSSSFTARIVSGFFRSTVISIRTDHASRAVIHAWFFVSSTPARRTFFTPSLARETSTAIHALEDGLADLLNEVSWKKELDAMEAFDIFDVCEEMPIGAKLTTIVPKGDKWRCRFVAREFKHDGPDMEGSTLQAARNPQADWWACMRSSTDIQSCGWMRRTHTSTQKMTRKCIAGLPGNGPRDTTPEVDARRLLAGSWRGSFTGGRLRRSSISSSWRQQTVSALSNALSRHRSSDQERRWSSSFTTTISTCQGATCWHGSKKRLGARHKLKPARANGSQVTRHLRATRRRVHADTIYLSPRGTYIQNVLDILGLGDNQCKAMPTPTVQTRQKSDEDEPRLGEDRRAYHRCVGILRHLLRYRPDIAFAILEVSKSLASPWWRRSSATATTGQISAWYSKSLASWSGRPPRSIYRCRLEWRLDRPEEQLARSTQSRANDAARIHERSELPDVVKAERANTTPRWRQ